MPDVSLPYFQIYLLLFLGMRASRRICDASLMATPPVATLRKHIVWYCMPTLTPPVLTVLETMHAVALAKCLLWSN